MNRGRERLYYNRKATAGVKDVQDFKGQKTSERLKGQTAMK